MRIVCDTNIFISALRFGGNLDKIIEKICLLVNPTTRVSIIKEKEDNNRILEYALEAKVDYIVTGDTKHILPLKNFQEIKIVTAAQFLEKLERKG